jgi:hypothetical protein
MASCLTLLQNFKVNYSCSLIGPFDLSPKLKSAVRYCPIVNQLFSDWLFNQLLHNSIVNQLFSDWAMCHPIFNQLFTDWLFNFKVLPNCQSAVH